MGFGRHASFWWGIVLLAAGVLWLLDATKVLALGGTWVGLVFVIGGLAFASLYARDEGGWWAAIPAGVLIGIGALIAFVETTDAPDEYGPSMLLGAMGLGFAAVYLRERRHWWALIPAGVLLSVGLMVGLVPVFGDDEYLVAVLFGGLAATFALLALVDVGDRRMRWPVIPAVGLALFAAVFAVGAADLLERLEWLVPAGMVVAGLLIVWRTVSARRVDGMQDQRG
ncbi:MAG TPA: hypothetical protein VFH63_07070 [candidate division Zixibacteria bacterium]|nr:hypothetical protein [candidate division Zixibacteria bacterium]